MSKMHSNYKKNWHKDAPPMGNDAPRNSRSARTPLSSYGVGGKSRTHAGKSNAAKASGLRGVKGGSGAKGAGAGGKRHTRFKSTSGRGRGGAVKGPY